MEQTLNTFYKAVIDNHRAVAPVLVREEFGTGLRHKVVSRAGLFRSGSGLKLTTISGLVQARGVLFVLGAQKYNQNNLVTLLNFSYTKFNFHFFSCMT